ncbi:MAG: CBS domain-containing protein [Candidatus Altiarchaeota archaeon]|nr:CBS domain-containing protein [Candidatus Altiarchaeota archaeon]
MRAVLASDVMSTPVVFVSLESTLQDVSKVMISRKVGSVLVSDGSQYVGIITKMDIVKIVSEGKNPKNTLAKNVMSSPLKTAMVSTPIMEIAKNMAREKIRRIVIKDNLGVVGVVSDKDVVGIAPEIIELITEHSKQVI